MDSSLVPRVPDLLIIVDENDEDVDSRLQIESVYVFFAIDS